MRICFSLLYSCYTWRRLINSKVIAFNLFVITVLICYIYFIFSILWYLLFKNIPLRYSRVFVSIISYIGFFSLYAIQIQSPYPANTFSLFVFLFNFYFFLNILISNNLIDIIWFNLQNRISLSFKIFNIFIMYYELSIY